MPETELNAAQRAALSDSAAHAAVTAAVVAGRRCADPVRAHTARLLFPLIGTVAAGDSPVAIGHAGRIAALVGSAAAADPSCRPLLLALERWLLHPGRDSATELSYAAASWTDHAPEPLRRRAWAAGPGMDAALSDIAEHGLQSPEVDPAIALIEEASRETVPLVWVSKRCGVSRHALRRRMRDRYR